MHVQRLLRSLVMALAIVGAGVAAPVLARDTVAATADDGAGVGEASYFGNEIAGNPTASGEPCDPDALTAAHRTLPLGTMVRVTNLKNGESVVVRINDRGPYARGRMIDLSRAAAKQIGLFRAGRGEVRIEVIGDDDGDPQLAAN